MTVARRLAQGAREGLKGWRWWQILSFLAGCASVAGALLSPLEALGRRDLITAHIAQHIILGDAAAPLLLLGLPPAARGWLRARLAGLRSQRGRGARSTTLAVSPVGALVLWSLAALAWCVPPLHRLAVTGGTVHLLDHTSFLGFGLLVWLGAIDPREPRALRRAVWEGGLPWWGRHAYAMGSRVLMLPPALLVWFAPGFHVSAKPPLGYSRASDQASAASLLIGFEMLLFAFTFLLAFVFLAVAEGKRQANERPG